MNINVDFTPVCLLMEMQGGPTEVEVSSRSQYVGWGSWGRETMFAVQHNGGWYLFAGWNGNGWNRYYVIEQMTPTDDGVLFATPHELQLSVRRRSWYLPTGW